MADPFRLSVMKALTARLKTISPANGYQNDLSDFVDSAGRPALRVFRGRTTFGDGDPLPMLSILEDPRGGETATATGTGKGSMNPFRVIVQGFVPDDKNNPLDPAYILSAEVITALAGAKDDRFNYLGLGSTAPCVMNIAFGQPVHRPADDEISATTYFAVSVTLTLAEDIGKPFPTP